MNDVLKCIYSRTSVRKYLPDQVPDADIKEIMKAGFHAANGMNLQPLRFIVIQNDEKKQEYDARGKAMFKGFLESVGAIDSPLMKMLSNPDYSIFFHAPILVGIYSNPISGTPVEDGCLAAGNMMLAAESMGYGTCFVGMAALLGEDPDFKRENNVPEDHKFIAMLTLGKPESSKRSQIRGEVPILNWSR